MIFCIYNFLSVFETFQATKKSIFQSAVCKALEAHENIKNADAVKTWFYRILINECLLVIKKRCKAALSVDFGQQEGLYFEKGYAKTVGRKKQSTAKTSVSKNNTRGSRHSSRSMYPLHSSTQYKPCICQGGSAASRNRWTGTRIDIPLL